MYHCMYHSTYHLPQVGLAVDDIKIFHEKAALKKEALQVKYHIIYIAILCSKMQHCILTIQHFI